MLKVRFGSTADGVIELAIASMADCISSAFAAQSSQQLWNSLRRRTTRRDAAGSFSRIFGRAAS